MTTLNNQSLPNFDRGYKWLHWSMAVLIFLMFLAVQGFANALTDADRMMMLIGHSSIGTIISLLMIVRVSKRFVKRAPRPVQVLAPWQKAAAKAVQLGLYFCMVFIPLTGFLTARAHQLPVMIFGVFDFNEGTRASYEQSAFETIRAAHEFGINLIMVLLVIHIGAVVYHKVVKKDELLASMTWRKNGGKIR